MTLSLHVEQLEERAVPTVNLVPYHFNFTAPTPGTLVVTSENVLQHTFKGTFTDANTGANIAVGGAWTPWGGGLDAIHFQGSARVPSKGHLILPEWESVDFNGWLQERGGLDYVTLPRLSGWMDETLTVASGLPGHYGHWSIDGWENVLGQP
jgi:hypothetical protein